MRDALLVFAAVVLLCVGLILVRRSFFRLAEGTAGLLNALLDDVKDEMEKQRRLIKAVGRQLKSLFIFLLLIAVVLAVAALPFVFTRAPGGSLLPDLGTWPAVLAMLIGGTLPFVVFSFLGKKRDYSEWSMLLHRMVLDNGNLGAVLFAWDSRRFQRKHSIAGAPSLLVSGLARAGTTALTTLLARSDRVHSLTYAHMPFLLCPYTWGRWVRPSKAPLKERSHGDKMLVGYASVEALEEYFFSVSLKGSYVEADALHEHNVDAEVYRKYVIYRELIGRGKPGSIYLAKNNNAILRYASLRVHEPAMKVVFLFRDPVEHAYSLMKQHDRFCRMQREDPFVLEYMDWLGHHEFGLGLKRFELQGSTPPTTTAADGMAHWLGVWMAYYTRLLVLVENDPAALLIDYADFVRDPVATVARIEKLLGMPLDIEGIERFENPDRFKGELDAALVQRARDLHMRLRERAAR